MENYSKTILTAIAIAIAAFSFGQDSLKTKGEKKQGYAQLTFFPPLSTQGIYSYQYKNHLSVNILAGVTGGVEGLEFGGLSNVSLGDVKGVQLAGLSNYNHGSLTGGQFAGLMNINVGDVNGGQGAGIMNVAIHSVQGVQAAGVINVATGEVSGPQFSGVLNFAAKKMKGVQAGLLNYATTVEGFQLGLVNISDSLGGGLPIGLFSFVRKGYQAVELEANETFLLNANLKTGVKRFYNIYTAGIGTRNGEAFSAVGLGFGTLIPLNEKYHLDIDAVSKTVLDRWWNYGYQGLNSLGITVSRKIVGRLQVFVGGSFNMAVSTKTDSEGKLMAPVFTPWSLKGTEGRYSIVQMYPGFKAGIRF